jgi:hypothetical protein
MDIVLYYIWGIISGLIISIFKDVIVKVLPISDDLRFRITYNLRKFLKMIRNTSLEVVYTLKTQNLEDRRISREDFITQIKNELIQKGFKFVGTLGSSLILKDVSGETEMEVAFTPSFSEPEEIFEKEEKILVSYVQADLRIRKCKYNRFDGHMVDLLQTVRKLEHSLEDYLGKWSAESLSCELRELYRFTGVLKGLDLSSLSGKVGGVYPIDLFDKKVIIYGSVNQPIISTLKKIITFYY